MLCLWLCPKAAEISIFFSRSHQPTNKSVYKTVFKCALYKADTCKHPKKHRSAYACQGMVKAGTQAYAQSSYTKCRHKIRCRVLDTLCGKAVFARKHKPIPQRSEHLVHKGKNTLKKPVEKRILIHGLFVGIVMDYTVGAACLPYFRNFCDIFAQNAVFVCI